MPTARCQYLHMLCAGFPLTVAERVHRHQHVSDVCLCLRQSLCPSPFEYWAGAGHALAGRRTYISPFSKRFFRFSLIASFETLLIRVRSETPTSFFLVVSKTAFFANCDFGCPPPAAAASFLRPARFVTAYVELQSAHVEGVWDFAFGAWYHG
jgi:hypothetical protein